MFFLSLFVEKNLQSDIEKSQTCNQSTDSKPEILANETTTEGEVGEEILFDSFDDSKNINREEEILSKTVSLKKDEDDDDDNDDQTRNKTKDKEEPSANKEVISNDSSSALSGLVSKTENAFDTEIEKNIKHGKISKQMISKMSFFKFRIIHIFLFFFNYFCYCYKMRKITILPKNFRLQT